MFSIITAIFRMVLTILVLSGATRGGGHDCSRPWPDLEIFIPINVRVGGDRTSEWYKYFLNSFLLFWPLKVSKTKLRLLIDDETVGSGEHLRFLSLVDNFTKSFEVARGIQVTSNNIPSNWYHGSGHIRQQLLMFYADNYTDAEYIGFGDTDCQFITYVDREDIFENGKPVINARIGVTGGWWWATVPKSTQWLMGGLEEPMRCMSYFPVVVKASHLKKMREYIFKVHNVSMDDHDVFRSYMGGAFSQFNAMCAYLWYFHRDEYTWYTHDTEPNAATRNGTKITNAPVGMMSDLSVYSKDMLRPKPRVAIHVRYHSFRKPIIEEGYCRSPPFPKRDPKAEAYCATRYPPYANGSSVFDDMHSFEDGNWFALFNQSSLIAEQSLRHERIKSCNHTWNKELFLALASSDGKRDFAGLEL